MNGWQRPAARLTVLAQLIGLMIALVLVVNGGRALSWLVPTCEAQEIRPIPSSAEPPLAGSPIPSKASGSPAPPFTPPPPTAIGPDDTIPTPDVPFVGSEIVDPLMPMVRLRVRAPARAQPDKEIEYRLTVENVSRAPAHHVIVRDRLPPGVRFVRAKPAPVKQPSKADSKTDQMDLLWDFGTLKPGERKMIVLAVHPEGTDEVKNSAYVQFEHGQTVTTRIAKAALRVRAIAPAQAVLYHPMTFRLEVANVGPAPAKDVVLTDELPAGLEFVSGKPELKPEKPLTWKLGDLAPGQTRRVEYEAISKQTGTFTNKVEVTAAGGLRQKASASVTVGEAKLAVIKTGPQRRLVNRPTPYQITVSNPGTMSATGVQVSDELPSGIEFLSASAGGRVVGGHVRWSLGTLPAGAQRSVQVVLRAPRPGRFGNMVQVKAEHNLSAKALAETRFETASGPTVEIDPSSNPLEVGQKATYTVRLTNPGSTAYLRPSLVITVPEEMTVLSQRGPTTAQREGQIIRFDALPALDAGREMTYTVEVEAKKVGEARLRVELTDGRSGLGPPQLWDEKTIIREAPRLAPQPVAPGLQVRQTHRR